MEDPLIKLFKSKPSVLELLGRVWEILYIEGSTPDIGKRRENFVRELLKEEFGLQIKTAPPLEREWDFSVAIEGKERKYNFKTTEEISTLKVAWNGFPSKERIEKFRFENPILYVVGDKKEKAISVCVFELDDLEELKKEMGTEMWWIPKSGTNPRGFGINTQAVRRLIEKAKRKGNFVAVKYKPVDVKTIESRYWKSWYEMLKKLALETQCKSFNG